LHPLDTSQSATTVTFHGWALTDIILAIVLVLGALKGLKRGFVEEVAGIVALCFALFTPWICNGWLDQPIAAIAHLNIGTAHVVGMVLTGIATFAVFMAIGAVLDKIAHLPLINLINAVAGAGVGFAKAVIVCSLLLYVALLLPIPSGIRSTLEQSRAIGFLTHWDRAIDINLEKVLPPFASDFLKAHT
jgi:uncharacterized membrane protein required for colicin V production